MDLKIIYVLLIGRINLPMTKRYTHMHIHRLTVTFFYDIHLLTWREPKQWLLYTFIFKLIIKIFYVQCTLSYRMINTEFKKPII